MPLRKREKEKLRACCAQLYSDDGVDPREDKRRHTQNPRKLDRKSLQLCKQVAQALQLALGALPEAGALVGVAVQAVVPAPNAGRLCAIVTVPDQRRRSEVAAVVERHSAGLRREVATAITRRRVPELVFDVVVEGGGCA